MGWLLWKNLIGPSRGGKTLPEIERPERNGELRTMKYKALLVSFALFVSFFSDGNGRAFAADCFYKDYLLRRMMLARIGASRGDTGKKASLESLKEEAIRIGMPLPAWIKLTDPGLEPDTTSARRLFSTEYDQCLYHRAQ